MHREDRLAAIAVIDRIADILRTELGEQAPALWPVLGPLLRNFLTQRPSTLTALADLSGLPRTTARRIMMDLQSKGWLEFRAVSESGKRLMVVPSPLLLDRLDRITAQTVAMMVGANPGRSLERFDGVNPGRDAGIPWPPPAAQGFNDVVTLTLVAYEAPVFDIIKRNRTDIERFVGHRVRILTYPPATYRATLDHLLHDAAPAEATAPMLVALPFPWLADLCQRNPFLELQTLLAESGCSRSDFYDAVWQAGWFNEQLYALPLQPMVDFFWYRQDLFEAEGLAPPRSFDDVIRAASRLHRPRNGRVGISWNAAPGLPLAETFLQILGAQEGLHVDEEGLQLDAELAGHVVEYLRALLAWSPANPHTMHWTRNAQMFGAGKSAMCYHWSNRYGMLDSHALLQKGGRVGLHLHPTYAADVVPLSPLSGALLAIPSSSSEPAARCAWRMIETLVSPELMKYFVLHGAAGCARYSVAEDLYVVQRNRAIAVIDQLARNHQIRTFPSPAMADYLNVVRILGDRLQSLLFEPATDMRKKLGALQSELVRAHRETAQGPPPRTLA